MDKVVVFGGAGFLGSHTADALTENGYAVTIFDNVESRWLRSDQEMVIGDILDQEMVRKVVQGARYLYHYAGVADISEAKEDPFNTLNLNVMGASIVTQAAVEAGVDRLVYASTLYVYSSQGSFYRASKQAAETIIEAYCDNYDLDYTFIRYGSLYGPRAQSWNGLRKYVEQVISEGRIVYSGSGREKREYIHVTDAARLSVDILDEKHANRAITVTGHQELSSSELIDMIFEIAGIKKEVVYSSENLKSEHYEMTPYRYTPKMAKKLIPEEFTDIGQGILELVEEISGEFGNKAS